MLPKRVSITRSIADADVTSPQDKEQLDATLWYYAKVEGPFSWEQMRHWHEAGM